VLLATGLAIAAAVLHAGWNLAVKASGDRFVFIWAMMAWGGLVSFPLLIVMGSPGWHVAGYIGASAAIHVVYAWFLARAYDLGDFGVAYPIARGGGALLAAVGGVVLLEDSLSPAATAGAAIVLGGLFSLARLRTSAPALGMAAATALTIGGYTLVDSAGSRSADSAGYGAALMVSEGLVLSAFGVATGRAGAVVPLLRSWRVALAGVAGAAAYIAVLVAVRHAPVGYVACLRESSVVLAALGGWLLLREPMARARILASCTVAGGVAVLVLGR
jgi:drug/metabolite transporter (DMT)-like permease